MSEIKSWATGVNKRVLREGGSWNRPILFIEDETRSGKRKRRLSATQQPRSFSVKFVFTETEYHTFDDWFKNTLKSGLYSFYFPVIDSSNKYDSNYDIINKVYRIAKDGSPQYENTSGRLVSCTMKWEEL